MYAFSVPTPDVAATALEAVAPTRPDRSPRLTQTAVDWLRELRLPGTWCAREDERELVAHLVSLPIPGLNQPIEHRLIQGFHAARWAGGPPVENQTDWLWHGGSADAFFVAMANAIENARRGRPPTRQDDQAVQRSIELREAMARLLEDRPVLCNRMAATLLLDVAPSSTTGTKTVAKVAPWPDVPAGPGENGILMPRALQRTDSGDEATLCDRLTADNLVYRLKSSGIYMDGPADAHRGAMRQLIPLVIEHLGLRETAVVCYGEEEEGQAGLPGDCHAAPQVLYVGHGGVQGNSRFRVTMKTAHMSYADAARNGISVPATMDAFLRAMSHAVEIAHGAAPTRSFDLEQAALFTREFFDEWHRIAKTDPRRVLRLTREDDWRPWVKPVVSGPWMEADRRHPPVACRPIGSEPIPGDTIASGPVSDAGRKGEADVPRADEAARSAPTPLPVGARPKEALSRDPESSARRSGRRPRIFGKDGLIRAAMERTGLLKGAK